MLTYLPSYLIVAPRNEYKVMAIKYIGEVSALSS